MKQCVIYARVSSKEQEKEGFSIPAQLELLREYAQRHNLQIAQEFTEAETAKVSGREKFKEMVKFLAQKKSPVILLVEKTDRLYRNFKDYVAVDDLINTRGIEVHLIKEGEILSKEAKSHTKLIHGIKVVLAKNYIDNLSEEVKKGMFQKVKEGGWPWRPPYGYLKEAKQLKPHPEQAQFVRRAFEIYETGMYSLQATISRLYEEGLYFSVDQPKILKGSLQRMLTSRAYIGQIEAYDDIFPGSHEPIVDFILWNNVQKTIGSHTKGKATHKHEFIYRGMIRCGSCGSFFTGEHKKEGRYTYYRCNGKGTKCSEKYINEMALDKIVTETFSSMLVPPEWRENIIGVIRELDSAMEKTVTEEMAKHEAKELKLRKQLRLAYQDKLEGTIDDEMWKTVSQDYQTQLANIADKRAKMGKADLSYYELANFILELADKLNMTWLRGTFDKKQQILNFAASNFFIKDGKVSLELKEPFCYLSKNGDRIKWWANRDAARTFLTLHSETIRRAYQSLVA